MIPTGVRARLRTTPRLLRGPITRGLAAGGLIDPEGGDFGGGLIRGLAVLTHGEVSGYGLWVDDVMLEQVRDAINREPRGIKSRFCHPGLSGDGLGKMLGRVRSARVVGDVTRADLHILKTAHQTPDGNLAAYVMKLATEDPGAFGASISFDPDLDAEIDYEAEQTDDYTGKFESPDGDNTKNLPHARLKTLAAVDLVDEPAANSRGLFHRGDVALDSWALTEYALGLSDDCPDATFGVAPDRVRGAVQRFMTQRGLTLIDGRKWRARARAVAEHKSWERVTV